MRLIGKTLLWGLLVLVLLAVGLPWLVGLYMAREFDQAVANLSVPGVVEVADRRFDRGWFRSHARIALRPVGLLCHATPCPVINLNTRIYHGPLAFGARQRGGLRPVLAMAVTRTDPTALWPRYLFSPVPGPLTLRTRVGLDTCGHVNLHLNGISFDVSRREPVAHVDTAAVEGSLTTSVAGRRVTSAKLVWPSFALAPETGGRLAWRNLRLAAEQAQRPDHLDHLSLAVESITLDNGQGRATRLRSVDGDLRRPDSGQARLSLDVREIVLPDNTQGELQLKTTVAGADPAAWAALPGQWQALGGLAGGAADDPRLYQEVLPDVLAPGFRFEIEQAALYTEHGPLRLTGHLAVPQALRAAKMGADTIGQLDIGLQIHIPAEFARRVAQRRIAARQGDGMTIAPVLVDQALQGLVDRGLITRQKEGDDSSTGYVVSLRVHDGQVQLNGRGQPGWQSVLDQAQAAIQGL